MPDRTEIHLDVSSALCQGARTRQEDALVTAFSQGADVGFAVLSDGMGGHAAGNLASRIIVTEIFAELTLRTSAPEFSVAEVPQMLDDAVEVANRCIRAHIESDASTEGMGGTVIAAVAVGGVLHWISVGDSPLYLYRDGELTRLNEDHSMAPQIDLMVREGLLDAREAHNHPQRNCLTSALIGEPLTQVDCPQDPLELRDGDLVLAASDGLQFLADTDIAAILRRGQKKDSSRLASDLIAGVREIGDPEQDNTSLVVIKVRDRRPADSLSAAPISPAAMFKAIGRAVAPVRQLRMRG